MQSRSIPLPLVVGVDSSIIHLSEHVLLILHSPSSSSHSFSLWVSVRVFLKLICLSVNIQSIIGHSRYNFKFKYCIYYL